MRKTQRLVPLNLTLYWPSSHCFVCRFQEVAQTPDGTLAITAKISVHVLTSTHTPIDRYRVTVLHAIAVFSNPHSRN
jgi:hypothetical protein